MNQLKRIKQQKREKKLAHNAQQLTLKTKLLQQANMGQVKPCPDAEMHQSNNFFTNKEMITHFTKVLHEHSQLK